MDTISAEYVVGLVDGEGSFTVYVKNPDSQKPVKRRTKVEPRFLLKLTEEDKDILYSLQKFFQCGNVYFQKDTRPNHKNCYRFEVSHRGDLAEKVIPFFESNALQLRTKRRDFEIFCVILDKVQRNEHLSETGLRAIYKLKQKMH
jgi:hypothetical protein